MDEEWIMLANASQARVYSRERKDGRLTELDDFVHPQSRQMGREIDDSRAGRVEKGLGASGHGSTQLESRTPPRQKQHEQFAHQLADYIDAAIKQRRIESWVLIASNPFLGEIKAHLSQHAEKALHAAVTSDLSSFTGPELERRVSESLQHKQ